MANFCDFEFRVIGKKKAVKAFYESTPYLDWKDVEYEHGTDSNYEMHFKGNCKWSINFDVEDDCDGVTADLSEETGVEYVGYSVRAKSEMFKCEVKVHYWSMESEFDQFDHYKNGECLKKRKISRKSSVLNPILKISKSCFALLRKMSKQKVKSAQ